MVNCTMILIRLGMMFLINEITRFENAHTTITANAITMEGSILVVTANAEQIPNTCTVIGLLSFNGSVTSFLFLVENNPSPATLIFTGSFTLSVLIQRILNDLENIQSLIFPFYFTLLFPLIFFALIYSLPDTTAVSTPEILFDLKNGM